MLTDRGSNKPRMKTRIRATGTTEWTSFVVANEMFVYLACKLLGPYKLRQL